MDIYDQVAEALTSGLSLTPATVERGFCGVLAVDIWRRWGAAMVLRVSERGQWSSDIYLEQVDADLRWHPVGDGGMHGDDWPSAAWSPSVDDGVLRIGQSQGTCVDDDGDEIGIVARSGFAGSDVRAVAVRVDDAQRVVDVAPGLHAFVVIGPAVTWRLTPLGSTGRPIGDVEVIEAQ